MKGKYIYILFLLMLGGLMAFQPKPKPKPKPVKAPKVVLSDKPYDVRWDKTFHDFGTVLEGREVKTTFVLTNVGADTVFIYRFETGGGGAMATFSKDPIVPGKSQDIYVHFNASGKSGLNSKSVGIITNGGHEILSFKCYVAQDTTKSLRTLPKYHIKQDINDEKKLH